MQAPLLKARWSAGRGYSYDVVIVGGGVAAICAAISLAEGGRSVAILERKRVGVGASGAFQGTIHTGAAYALRRPDLAAELVHASSLWKALSGLSEGNNETWLMTNSPLSFRRFCQNARGAGIDFAIVGPDELNEVFTSEATGYLRAARVAEMTVSPREVMTRLTQRALDLGVDIHTHRQVIDLVRDGSRVAGVVTRAGLVSGDVTVLAAGWGNRELMRTAEVGQPEDIVGITNLFTVVANRSLQVAVRSMDAGGVVAVPHDGVVDLNVTERRQTRTADFGRPLLNELDAVGAVEAARRLFRSDVINLASATGQLAIKPEYFQPGAPGERNLSSTVSCMPGVTNLLLLMPGKFTSAPLAAMEVARMMGVQARNPLSGVGERVGPEADALVDKMSWFSQGASPAAQVAEQRMSGLQLFG